MAATPPLRDIMAAPPFRNIIVGAANGRDRLTPDIGAIHYVIQDTARPTLSVCAANPIFAKAGKACLGRSTTYRRRRTTGDGSFRTYIADAMSCARCDMSTTRDM